MSNHKRAYWRRFSWTALLLSTLWNDTSFAQSCWVESPYPGQCLNELSQICIELELGGQPVATECCSDYNCQGCVAPPEPVPERLTYNFTEIFPESMIRSTKGSRHPIPRVPLRIDHVAHSSEEVTRFDGLPLHFLMCRVTIEQSSIFAFTTTRALYDQLYACQIRASSFAVPEAPAEPVSGVAFYDGSRWTGASYFLPSGQSLELSETWWNQRISSLRGAGSGTFLTLFENADRSGSSLTLTSDLGWPDLGSLGWDDRATALVVWPETTIIVPVERPWR